MKDKSWIYKPIYKEKRVSLKLPFNIRAQQRFYFANDQEILNAVTEFIIPNTASLNAFPKESGAPYATYIDGVPLQSNLPLGANSNRFFICIAEVGTDNKFLYYNMPISSFANGYNAFISGQQSLPMLLNARINLGKSYIFTPENITLPEEEPRTFNMLLRYTKK